MIDPNPTRRTVLGGVAGLAALAVGAGAAPDIALGGGPDGLARSFDTNDDGDAEMVIRRVSDPPGGRTGSVINATTDGADTPDYAASLARLASEQLTLDELVADGFAYDYYEGSASTSPGPDEVWLVIHSTEDGEQGRHILFRKETDSGTDSGGNGTTTQEPTWSTRDVAAELVGDFSAGESGEPWKEFHIDGRSIEPVAESDGNIVATYGADASVKWAGIGRGSPGWESFVANTYYDAFTVAGEERSLPVTDGKGGGGAGDGDGGGGGGGGGGSPDDDGKKGPP